MYVDDYLLYKFLPYTSTLFRTLFVAQTMISLLDGELLEHRLWVLKYGRCLIVFDYESIKYFTYNSWRFPIYVCMHTIHLHVVEYIFRCLQNTLAYGLLLYHSVCSSLIAPYSDVGWLATRILVAQALAKLLTSDLTSSLGFQEANHYVEVPYQSKVSSYWLHQSLNYMDV